MQGSELLSLLRTFLVLMGILSAVWGIYNLMGDSGAQNGVAWTKILGGIAFSVIVGIAITRGIEDIKEQESQLPANVNTYNYQSISTKYNVKGIDYGG